MAVRVDAILFACGGRIFGVEVAAVSEVIQLENISPVPMAPSVVVGAAEIGGKVLPVVDVAVLLGLAAQLRSHGASGLHVTAGDHELLLLACEVRGVCVLERAERAAQGEPGELAEQIDGPKGEVALLSARRVGEAVERHFDRIVERRR